MLNRIKREQTVDPMDVYDAPPVPIAYERYKQHLADIIKDHLGKQYLSVEGERRIKWAREALKRVGPKGSAYAYENVVLSKVFESWKRKGM